MLLKPSDEVVTFQWSNDLQNPWKFSHRPFHGHHLSLDLLYSQAILFAVILLPALQIYLQIIFLKIITWLGINWAPVLIVSFLVMIHCKHGQELFVNFRRHEKGRRWGDRKPESCSFSLQNLPGSSDELCWGSHLYVFCLCFLGLWTERPPAYNVFCGGAEVVVC